MSQSGRTVPSRVSGDVAGGLWVELHAHVEIGVFLEEGTHQRDGPLAREIPAPMRPDDSRLPIVGEEAFESGDVLSQSLRVLAAPSHARGHVHVARHRFHVEVDRHRVLRRDIGQRQEQRVIGARGLVRMSTAPRREMLHGQLAESDGAGRDDRRRLLLESLHVLRGHLVGRDGVEHRIQRLATRDEREPTRIAAHDRPELRPAIGAPMIGRKGRRKDDRLLDLELVHGPERVRGRRRRVASSVSHQVGVGVDDHERLAHRRVLRVRDTGRHRRAQAGEAKEQRPDQRRPHGATDFLEALERRLRFQDRVERPRAERPEPIVFTERWNVVKTPLYLTPPRGLDRGAASRVEQVEGDALRAGGREELDWNGGQPERNVEVLQGARHRFRTPSAISP